MHVHVNGYVNYKKPDSANSGEYEDQLPLVFSAVFTFMLVMSSLTCGTLLPANLFDQLICENISM